jgi:DNA mismatch repair protein MutL
MNLDVEQNRIHLLPEHIIDQIKAGEVVERPANVIKELLENSIDAKSTHIKITIKDNGLDLIAIEDNGQGMRFDELPYAFCRHATSKITSFEDIYRLNTFGFRGEALASISSIARISCHSTPADDPQAGGKFVIHGAETIEHAPYKSDEPGTSIFVRDLFFNTPVRLKFVKSKISEKNALKRIINAFIVSNPHINFTVSWDDEDKEIYRPAKDQAQRFLDLITNKKKKDEVISFDSEYLKNHVSAYVSKSSTKGKTGKHQYLFVNGRLFSDKKIHQIVVRNMEKYWDYGTAGHYIIDIKVPENEIDVNVHPNKILIKFLKENEVFALISATLKELIKANARTPELGNKELNFDTNNHNLVDDFMERNRSYQPSSSFYDQQSTIDRSQFGQDDLFTQSSSNLITSLGENLFLLNHDDKHFFLDASLLVAATYKKLFNKVNNEVTPLLISEPLDIKEKSNEKEILDILLEVGFEIDRIAENTLVVRTVPTEFERVPYLESLEQIIVGGIKEISEVSYLELVDTKYSADDMISLFNESELIRLIEENVLVPLKPKQLKKFIYGK